MIAALAPRKMLHTFTKNVLIYCLLLMPGPLLISSSYYSPQHPVQYLRHYSHLGDGRTEAWGGGRAVSLQSPRKHHGY